MRGDMRRDRQRLAARVFISTSLQRGREKCDQIVNRFSGFSARQETTEAVITSGGFGPTSLKRGVNDLTSPLTRWRSRTFP